MTPEAKTLCPRCGNRLPAGSDAKKPCPRCLLQLGLESFESGAGSALDRAPAPTPDELAQAFPQLEILSLVGQGGMGAVYKARQRDLDRLVALKVLILDQEDDPAFAERFVREAQALASLKHPHVIAVHDFGQSEGYYYLLLEYVDGPNLRELIRSKALAPTQALAVVGQVCEALQFAHDQGIVHRDIKPENILLDSTGRAMIADFGLAKILRKAPNDRHLTGTHQAMGTVHYMAPEQIERPLEVDHRADIYSLGVVLYELLTGELPLGQFPPVSKQAGVDVRLDEVVGKTLQKEPAERYQSATHVRADVEGIARGGSAPQAAAAPAATIKPSRGPLYWLGVVLLTLLIGFPLLGCLGAALLSLWGAPRAVQQQNQAEHAMEDAERQRDEAVRAAEEAARDGEDPILEDQPLGSD